MIAFNLACYVLRERHRPVFEQAKSCLRRAPLNSITNLRRLAFDHEDLKPLFGIGLAANVIASVTSKASL